MTDYDAGDAKLRIVPDAREFKTLLDADLEKIKAEFEVRVTAEVARAREEVDKFRAEQEARPVKIKTETDKSSFSSAFKDLEKAASDTGEKLVSAFKFNAIFAGIGLIPAAATAVTELAGALEQLAGAGLAIPGIMAGAVSSIGTLALGLSGVKEAYTALGKEATSAGQDQTTHAREVASANNELESAVREQGAAERDRATAVRESRQELEDLNLQLRGSGLSEKEAMLNAEKAREDYATGTYKTATDRELAALRIQRADQTVAEAHQHTIELQQKAADENAKGVENSDKVVAANDRVASANQRVAQAQSNVDTANNKLSSSAQAVATAMANLSPSAQEFVHTLHDMTTAGGVLNDFQGGVQENLFAGWSDSIKTLVSSDLPTLKGGLGGVATSLNGDFKQLFASLGSDSTKGFLQRIFGDTAQAQDILKNGIDPLVHAIGTLAAAGSDTLPRLATAFDHVVDRFDHFITAAAQDGRLDKWINDGLTAFGHLGDILLNIGKIFHDLTDAAGGKGLLGTIDDLTTKWATFLGSPEGQAKLREFFEKGKEDLAKWVPILENIIRAIPSLIDAARQWTNTLLPPLERMTKLLGDHPDLVKAVAFAFVGWKSIEGVVSVAKTLGTITDLLGKLPDLATKAGGKLADAFPQTFGPTPGTPASGGAIPGGPPGPTPLRPPVPAFGGGAPFVVWDSLDEHAKQTLEQAPIGLQQAFNGKNPFIPKNWDADKKAAQDYLRQHPDDTAAKDWLHKNVDFLGYDQGGPTPDNPGPLPDGGHPAIVHPKEFVTNKIATALLGPDFLSAANQGVVNPTLLPGDGTGPLPGPATGSDPDAEKAKADKAFLANWGANLIVGGGEALYNGVLGAVGLDKSILSPNNTYTADAAKLIGRPKGGDSAGDIGSQSITLGDGSVIQLPTYGTSGVPDTGAAPQLSGSHAGGPATVASVTPASASSSPGSSSGGGVGQSAGHGIGSAPTSGNEQTVYQAMLNAGFPASEWGSLHSLLMGESGFRNTAQNPSSTAYGMFQFLDTTWAGVGGSKTSDPSLQSKYGLQYIKQRYGTPSAAWAFWQAQSPHWYDEGGFLPEGLSLNMNQTGKPEPVLTHEQGKAVQAIGDAATKPRPNVPDAQTKQPAPQPVGVAPAPASQDHNAPGVQTGIQGAASAVGNAASTAASFFGGGAGGAGSLIGGVAKQGGQIASGAVNVLSSFLVGNLSGGTTGDPYGQTYHPQQRAPRTAATRVTNQNGWTVADPHEMRQALDLHDAQQQQSFWANQ